MIKKYLVYGLDKKGKRKEILGSVNGHCEKNVKRRLNSSGSLLDTPKGSKYPRYLLKEKKVIPINEKIVKTLKNKRKFRF